jgi:hypothetical protein
MQRKRRRVKGSRRKGIKSKKGQAQGSRREE